MHLGSFGCIVEDGVLSGKDILMYNVFQVVANAVAALSNAISAGVIGTLLVLCSKTRAKKGSLTRE